MPHLRILIAAGIFGGLLLLNTPTSEAQNGGLGKSGIKKIAPAEDCPAEGCGQFGTSVNFVATPSEAAKQAEKEEKLVFVLHVSGNFENPDFT